MTYDLRRRLSSRHRQLHSFDWNLPHYLAAPGGAWNLGSTRLYEQLFRLCYTRLVSTNVIRDW